LNQIADGNPEPAETDFIAMLNRHLLKRFVKLAARLGGEFVAQGTHGIEIEEIAPFNRAHGGARPPHQNRAHGTEIRDFTARTGSRRTNAASAAVNCAI
jgi:hypothetical protein